jgi:hypothetical protein
MEKILATSLTDSGICKKDISVEGTQATGTYTVKHIRDGVVLSEEQFSNVVCNEGKNAMLTNTMKGSSYTAVNYMGLISSASYTSAPVVGDTMASHSTWTEAGTTNAPTFAARLAPSFGTASGGSLGQSATTNFTMTGAGTVKGCFLAIKDMSGTAPTSAPLNTSGALYSAGLFGSDKVVSANDVIQVTYSTSL